MTRGRALRIGVSAAAAFMLPAGCERPERGYALLRTLATVTAPGDSLLEPLGVAAGVDGTIYVADARRGEVISYTAGGTYRSAWSRVPEPDGKLSRPVDLALGPDDRVYVVDFDLDRVFVFDRDGEPLVAWGDPGSGAGQLASPAGIGVGDDGIVYVAEFENHRVQVFQPDGTYLRTMGSEGHGRDELYYPTDVTPIEDGVCVSDAYNHRVVVFARDGVRTVSRGRSVLRVPVSAALTAGGTIHVADSENRRVVAFDPRGRIIGEHAFTGPVRAAVNSPGHLTASPGGVLNVADPARGRVVILRWGS